ncbi:MAG: GldG family protein [Myxococcota bacterium]
MNKRSRAATQSLTLLAITGGILVLLNVLGQYGHARFDVTENRAFSLSQGSRRVASNLEDRLEITAYFTEDLPPPFNTTERYVRDMLAEYEAASGGEIRVRIVHPDTEEEQQEAEQDGVQRVRHQAVEDDSLSVVEGYRGIVMKYLGDKKVLAAIEDTAGLEYTLTTAMKELVGDKRTIGVVQGHGMPTPQEGLSKLPRLLPNYEVKPVSAEEPIDGSIAALLVVNPSDALSETELLNIDQYLMRGGSVGFFGGSMKVDLKSFESLAASQVDTGVNRLLERWGLELRSDVVADAQCQSMPMRSSIGLQVTVPYPPIPLVSFEEEEREHPVLFRLNGAVFPFASSVDVKDPDDEEVETVALAQTSENSWRLTGASIPLQPRQPQQWQPSGEMGPFTMLAAAQGNLPSAFAAPSAAMSSAQAQDGPEPEIGRAEETARVLVFGTGSLLLDQFMPTPEQLQQQRMNSGVAIVLNAIDWLAQDSDLIAIRAKNVEEPTLEVPRSVEQAEVEAKEAEQEAQAAARAGDRQTAEQAAEEVDQALERRKKALGAWETRKKTYRWGNMLGVPALLAVFGVVRWRMRTAKKQRLKV